MKKITILIDMGNGWEVLHQGSERVKVELDPQDQEGAQIEAILFDPNAPDEVQELPWLEHST